MNLDVMKGGKGKKAPYRTTHYRIPEPIKPLVERIALAYKAVAGYPSMEEQILKGIEHGIANAINPMSEQQQKTSLPDLSKLKTYKLHGKDVVRVDDLIKLFDEV